MLEKALCWRYLGCFGMTPIVNVDTQVFTSVHTFDLSMNILLFWLFCFDCIFGSSYCCRYCKCNCALWKIEVPAENQTNLDTWQPYLIFFCQLSNVAVPAGDMLGGSACWTWAQSTQDSWCSPTIHSLEQSTNGIHYNQDLLELSADDSNDLC